MSYLALEHIAREILSGNVVSANSRNIAIANKNAAELDRTMQIQSKIIDDEEDLEESWLKDPKTGKEMNVSKAFFDKSKAHEFAKNNGLTKSDVKSRPSGWVVERNSVKSEELYTAQQGKTDGSDAMKSKGPPKAKAPIKIPPKADGEIDPDLKVKLGAHTPIIINPSMTMGNKDRNTEGQATEKGKKIIVKPKNEERLDELSKGKIREYFKKSIDFQEKSLAKGTSSSDRKYNNRNVGAIRALHKLAKEEVVDEGILKNAAINIKDRAVKGVIGEPRNWKPKNIVKRAVHGVFGTIFDKPKKKRKLKYEMDINAMLADRRSRNVMKAKMKNTNPDYTKQQHQQFQGLASHKLGGKSPQNIKKEELAEAKKKIKEDTRYFS